MANGPQKETLPTNLGMWDAVSIIVGIVIGAGIYETPPDVFSNLSGPPMVAVVWIVAGVLSLLGALCYAELATAYPQAGGDYVYLTRAYGRWVGFLFGWAQLAVILTANIGMMGYVFADYLEKFFDLPPGYGYLWAGAAVLVLTILNVVGIRAGKLTQNILTVTKVLGLSAVILVGLAWPGPPSQEPIPLNPKASLAYAMVLVFLTYGGWNDAAYVAAELRNGRRNIPRALVLGTSVIVLLYLLVNFAYLNALGFLDASNAKAIAASVLERPLGAWGNRAMCLLVMISALGAANGLIFTGARVALSLGRDHPLFAWLGRWQARRGSPYVALWTQAAISLGMILLVGLPIGQSMMTRLFDSLGLEVHWSSNTRAFGSGFFTLLRCTAPIFWLFFLLTGISLFILRYKDTRARAPDPFPVPFYPVTPLVFCATCGYMLYSGILFAEGFGLVGAFLLLLGLPLYAVSQWMLRRQTPSLSSAPTADKL